MVSLCSPYPSILTELSTNTLYGVIFYSGNTIYCGVFNEKHHSKTLILINKDWLANKKKSILLALISVAKKTMKIAKLVLNLLAIFGGLVG
ncbi:hypothetical protein AOR11_00210 [Vibrio alginolyticus]|uniref:Uncharacterized protein n=1 Tax=Vibrio alginolyticus TaxID=663 RepID=A0ABX4X9B5_VIBAL|nr:hypothetical protein AL541_06655 [Vibrio alginolyticus]QCO87943.1 hypothetical protein D3H41_18105 [Vibrio neocaledonicus]AVF68430.1 hypothetical protein AL545_04630 [Vibrio alginolyticus]EGR1294840.1 hypothetical protein [Vibrio alginolyticus]EGR1574308.1 hypothetical protein [Vibrio alginolyticus]